MPTPPDLTPWPALLEAVAKRWPDAPRIPMGLVNFHRKNEPFIRTNTEIGDSFEAHRYMADAVLIRWATEFGAWWVPRGDGRRYTVQMVQFQTHECIPDDMIPSGEERRFWWAWAWCVRWGERYIEAPTLLSAHAAAVGAIVGTP